MTPGVQQWKARRIPNRRNGQIDGERRPVQVARAGLRDVDQFGDGRVREPRKIDERHKQFLALEQQPCAETLVTSRAEVPLPCAAKRVFMVVNEFGNRAELAVVQSGILRQLDVRLEPELRLSIGACDMDARSPLSTGAEKEALTVRPEKRRAHVCHGRSNDGRFTLPCCDPASACLHHAFGRCRDLQQRARNARHAMQALK